LSPIQRLPFSSVSVNFISMSSNTGALMNSQVRPAA
jgi:hypothetical protein